MKIMTNEDRKQEICEIIKLLHSQGKSPATSTNYSFLGIQQEIFVSRSGVDKSKFAPEDFIEVDSNGKPLPPYQDIKPSAETLIHCFLYQNFADVGCVLHTHSVPTTVLSALFAQNEKISFSGYEVIKGIQGNDTHETTVDLPILHNAQDMQEFCEKLALRRAELKHYGFLIAKHGIYAWGKDIPEAKRHLEVWEYMLECEFEILRITGKL
jgi:methylthioribulose-1-phosphate dehydratase